MLENLRRKVKKSAYFVTKTKNIEKINAIISELELLNAKIFTDYELAKEIIFNSSNSSCLLLVCDEDLISQSEELNLKNLAEKHYLPFEIFNEDTVRSIREAFLMAFYKKYKKH